MSTTRLIKKYPNRRLYDRTESKYISTADIRQFICRGDKITVIDEKTDKDITGTVLLNILAEQYSSEHAPLFNEELLGKIVAYDDPFMAGIFCHYLEQCFKLFSEHHDWLRQQAKNFDGFSPYEIIQTCIDAQHHALQKLIKSDAEKKHPK